MQAGRRMHPGFRYKQLQSCWLCVAAEKQCELAHRSICSMPAGSHMVVSRLYPSLTVSCRFVCQEQPSTHTVAFEFKIYSAADLVLCASGNNHTATSSRAAPHL
jgi:hypothetical protein